jgi:SAM-dependent methyltransferase
MKAMILSHPALYQAYQAAGGFFGARIKAIADYLTMRPGMRVIDIGCGPGHILPYLPEGTIYNGFDIDETYIAYAKRSFGHLGAFHCRYFDAAAAREFAGADLVMMNGVCYREGQSSIAKWLIDNDRGEFVRDEDGYNKVLGSAFPNVKLAIREDLSRLPSTFAIGVMQK